MKKNKVFIACDSTNITKIKEIINKTKNPKIKIGYKFGLEFLNSKKGRHFVSKLKRPFTAPITERQNKKQDNTTKLYIIEKLLKLSRIFL